MCNKREKKISNDEGKVINLIYYFRWWIRQLPIILICFLWKIYK